MRRAWIAAGLLILAALAGSRLRRNAAAPAPVEPRRKPAHAAFWDVYARAGQARMAGRVEDARRLYAEALQMRPDHEDALYYHGSCAFELGRGDEARASYERLVAVNPSGSSRGYMQLGLLHASMDTGARDLDQAQRYLDQALAVDPDSGAVLALGELALLRGDLAAAGRRLAEASAGDPMSVAAPYLLGYLDWDAGRRDEAWRLFQTAVARGESKKPAVQWTEEGDVKADPALRWKALARQSLTGRHWIRLRAYLAPPGPSRRDMDAEYRELREGLVSPRAAAGFVPRAKGGR